MKLEWFILNYNFNKQRIEDFNIFRNTYFTKSVEELLKEHLTFEEFVIQLDRKLMYYFWSKREYEISVGDAFEEDINKYKKIDVYSQVKPNIKILAKYIIDNYKVS